MAQLSIPVEKALALPPQQLGELLEPGVEYTGILYRKVPCCVGSEKGKKNRYIRVGSTLPTLAAALNKPELLRFLLDRGYDVNSASQAAVEALVGDKELFSFLHGTPIRYPGARYANASSSITAGTLKALREPLPFQVYPFQLNGVTPLAAAILCGSVDCVRVLIERPDIWTTECPAVSVALALDWRAGDADYTEACRLSRTLSDGSLRPLALRSVIDLCSVGFLRAELSAAAYDTRAVREAAALLLDKAPLDTPSSSSLVEKLGLLAGHDPRAFQAPMLRGLLASMFLKNQGNTQLHVLVNRFCGGCSIDLGYAPSVLRSMPTGKLGVGLDTLCAVGTPVLSCDAVEPAPNQPPAEQARRLRLLLERVRFLPGSYSVGLSSLTCSVLKCGSLPVLELALEKGAIPAREPLDMMLPLVSGNSALRAKLLAAKRPDTPLSPPDWTGCCWRKFPEAFRMQALSPDAPADACRLALTEGLLYDGKLQCPCLDLPIGRVKVIDAMLFFSMAGRAEPLRDLLLAQPRQCRCCRVDLPRRRKERFVDGWMELTPLCAAALAGQAETVEMLLSLGYDANERDIGFDSSLHMVLERAPHHGSPVFLETASRDLPLSPLLCAAVSGSAETAAVLRAHGAVWDMETESARYAMEALEV